MPQQTLVTRDGCHCPVVAPLREPRSDRLISRGCLGLGEWLRHQPRSVRQGHNRSEEAQPCGSSPRLDESIESLDQKKLLEAARLCPVVWSQRLGYLLERVGRDDLASVLADHVRTEAATLAPLVRARSMKDAPRDEPWRLAINASVVETDQ